MWKCIGVSDTSYTWVKMISENSGENPPQDGEDGFSPIATVTQAAEGATISITDKNGTTTATVKNGKDGKDGIDATPVTPLFANSIAECTDTTKPYVLADGYIYAYVAKKVEGGTTPNFTDQLPIAEDMASTEPFNGKGYMTGVYLSSTETGYNTGAANEWTTGYIPYASDKSIYIKGVGFTSASHDRLYLFSAKDTDVKTSITGSNVSTYFTVETLGDNYYKLTPESGAGFAVGIQYVRMSFTTGTPSGVIITVNQPITYTTVEGGMVYEWANTGHAFVPADYEGRIIAAEESIAENATDIESLSAKTASLEAEVAEIKANGVVVPDGVQTAASALVDKALSRGDSRILRFLVSTDAHQDNTNALITKGNRELGQAHGEILKLMGVDFVANLGDITWGATGSSNESVLEEAKTFNGFMLEHLRGQTQIWTEGNHETALLTESQIHGLMYSHNKELVQNPDQWIDGYGYMDFPNQKVRVICLNTDQATGNDTSGVSDNQLTWFAETALDMSGKSDWSVITMSHHPLDFNNITMYKNCVWVLEAFLEGTALDFTTNTGTKIDVDYGDKSCQYVGHFHGHAHAFSVVKMQKWVGTNAYEEVDAWEICIPNACYTRNNQYAQDAYAGQYVQRYVTDTTYNKSDEDGKRTSFNLLTVCLDERKIYADNYGAGIDREISY